MAFSNFAEGGFVTKEFPCIVSNIYPNIFALIAGFISGYMAEEKEILVSFFAIFFAVFPILLITIKSFSGESNLEVLSGITMLLIPMVSGIIGGILAIFSKKFIRKQGI